MEPNACRHYFEKSRRRFGSQREKYCGILSKYWCGWIEHWTYAQNHQLPASVSQAVMLELQARTNEYLAVEHAAEDGELDWSEAKPEMVRIKEEGKINLTELLGGEEEYQEFERFVWGGK